MAVTILKNVGVWIADSTSVLITNRVKSCSITYTAESVDTTAFSSSTGIKTKTFTPGMVEWSADLEIFQDYAAGGVDATLFPLVGQTSPVRFVVTTAPTVDANSPQYSGAAFIMDYSPISGSVGEAAPLSLKVTGIGPLTRNTASSSGPSNTVLATYM